MLEKKLPFFSENFLSFAFVESFFFPFLGHPICSRGVLLLPFLLKERDVLTLYSGDAFSPPSSGPH